MPTGCSKLTKGSHPKDDLIPCGTTLYLGVDREPKTIKIHLCPVCKAKQ